MNYLELLFTTLPTEDFQQDLLINALGEIGFDTFEELDFGFKAYIPADVFDQEQLDATLLLYKDMFSFTYETTLIPQKNWNEVWESNFDPIQVGGKIYVRASFHAPQPNYEYEIVIDPKMAFGTGHHQTTSMMLDWALETDFKDKKVLDMGCGTGILAIMAAKLGATDITAIDYDPVCYDSTIENARLNNAGDIKALCGSKEVIPDERFDIILANINRNILIDQLSTYASALREGGELYLSGFYDSPDLEIINNDAITHHFKFINRKKADDWVAAKYVKEVLPL